MDPTLPPDIPDPASATPVNPASPGESTPIAPVVPRPPRPKVPRLPGTYAANYDGDVSWRKGVAALWVLFGLVAVGETLHAAFVLLANRPENVFDFGKYFTFHYRTGGAVYQGLYPSILDLVRVGAEAVLFLTLWLGWGWTRWLLAVVNFLSGAGFVMWTIADNAASRQILPPGKVSPSHAILMLPGLWLGIVYLVGAGYVAFSANVAEFIRHRRGEGRGWVIVPLALSVGGGALLLLFGSPVFYFNWLGAQKAPAEQFAKESLQAMAEHWDPAVFAARGDEAYLKAWTEDQRKGTFGTLVPMGPLQSVANTQSTAPNTILDPNGMQFAVEVHYDVPQAVFAHGHAHFNLLVRRHLFEPWRLGTLGITEVYFEPQPEAPASP